MSRPAPETPALSQAGAAKLRTSDVLRSVVDLFVQAPSHERVEVRAFADLLSGLLPDAGPSDRLHVARQLARRADTPPSVARLLSMDAAEIAAAMILNSPVLTSADLVEIMRCGPAHVTLVAERLDLAPDIATALTRSTEIEAPARPAAVSRHTPIEPQMRVREIVEEAADRPRFEPEVEADIALFRALDELAAELEAEANGGLAGDTADAPRAAEPTVSAGDSAAFDRFLAQDPAGRWRIIQDMSSAAALAPASARRRRAADPTVIGTRLFSALVAGEQLRLVDELTEATGLDRSMVERLLRDRDGEALAVTLAALGIDERTATSILLLHTGETADLAHMQDLSAMAGRIGWRTAEHMLGTWRGDRAGQRTETARVLDPADRRGSGRTEIGAERSRTVEEPARRHGGEG